MLEDIPKCDRKVSSTYTRIWTKIVHNLRLSLDSIKDGTQQAEIRTFEVPYHKGHGIFYMQFVDKLE